MPTFDITQIPFDDFETATRTVLKYLHKKYGFSLWMMTRTEGNDWIILQAEDHGYNVKEGTVFNWADSFCSKMVEGDGPRIAPCSNDIPIYATSAIGRQVEIKAYIGVPVVRKDGSLFGTLCAIDSKEQSHDLLKEQETIELLARLLETVLEFDFEKTEQKRLLEHAQQEALIDELTQIFNRRAWERSIELEESRSKRYGSPSIVFMIDLDGLKTINDTEGHTKGDNYIISAGNCLSQIVRKTDVVARIGGDEFAILAVETDLVGGKSLFNKIKEAFKTNDIKASIGMAIRNPELGLKSAIEEADNIMYKDKLLKKTQK